MCVYVDFTHIALTEALLAWDGHNDKGNKDDKKGSWIDGQFCVLRYVLLLGCNQEEFVSEYRNVGIKGDVK